MTDFGNLHMSAKRLRDLSFRPFDFQAFAIPGVWFSVIISAFLFQRLDLGVLSFGLLIGSLIAFSEILHVCGMHAYAKYMKAAPWRSCRAGCEGQPQCFYTIGDIFFMFVNAHMGPASYGRAARAADMRLVTASDRKLLFALLNAGESAKSITSAANATQPGILLNTAADTASGSKSVRQQGMQTPPAPDDKAPVGPAPHCRSGSNGSRSSTEYGTLQQHREEVHKHMATTLVTPMRAQDSTAGEAGLVGEFASPCRAATPDIDSEGANDVAEGTNGGIHDLRPTAEEQPVRRYK